MNSQSNDFTNEEIRVLKEMAQDRLYFEDYFLTNKDGSRVEKGNYSDWVKAMKRGGNTNG